jgi:hypothetical protein
MSTTPDVAGSQEVLQYLQVTSAAMDQAKREREKQAAAQAEVDKLIPQAAEALVKFARIDAVDRKEAEALLRDPVTALKILIKTANPSDTVEPTPLGDSANGRPQVKVAHLTHLLSPTGEQPSQARLDADRRYKEKLRNGR